MALKLKSELIHAHALRLHDERRGRIAVVTRTTGQPAFRDLGTSETICDRQRDGRGVSPGLLNE